MSTNSNNNTNNKDNKFKNNKRNKKKNLRNKGYRYGRINKKKKQNNGNSSNNNVNNNGFKRYMRVLRTDDTSMVVTGMDLVYSVQELEEQFGNDKQVLTIIPANPAYWVGTRVASIATAYQKFRPLKFVVHYVPMVSYLQRGNVFGGTIWDNLNVPKTKIQQTLVTTPGGLSTQACKPKTAEVKCKDNLSKNLYSIAGQLDQVSNPFYYVAIGVGNFNDENQRVTPGFFWVSYTYSFKNPVGMNTHFSNLGLISLDEMLYKPNTTAMLGNYKTYKIRGETRTLAMFTEVQIDTGENGDLITKYNGDYVPINDEDRLWVFQNYDVNEDVYNKIFILNPKASRQIQPTQGAYALTGNNIYLIWLNEETNIFQCYINGNQNVSFNKSAMMIESVFDLEDEDVKMFAGIPIESFRSNFAVSGAGGITITFQKRTIQYKVNLQPTVQNNMMRKQNEIVINEEEEDEKEEEEENKIVEKEKNKENKNKEDVDDLEIANLFVDDVNADKLRKVLKNMKK